MKKPTLAALVRDNPKKLRVRYKRGQCVPQVYSYYNAGPGGKSGYGWENVGFFNCAAYAAEELVKSNGFSIPAGYELFPETENKRTAPTSRRLATPCA